MNSMFKSVNAPSFASVSREELSKKGARDEPGPSTYCVSELNLRSGYVRTTCGGPGKASGARQIIAGEQKLAGVCSFTRSLWSFVETADLFCPRVL